jgi:hypothetical protein
MPTKSIRIFQVIAQFANLDLTTGKPLRNLLFYPGYIKAIKNGVFYLTNGVKFNSKNGDTNIKSNINRLIVAEYKKDGSTALSSYRYDKSSNINFLYLKSIGMGVVVDNKTLNSNYVKMFLLGIYDKELFELVDNSIYGKVYRLKR